MGRIFRIPFFFLHPLSRGDEGAFGSMDPCLTTMTHFLQFGTNGLSTYRFSLTFIDYGAQKPAFEKFSSKWCFSSFNINESFSVCSSDRKLGNEMTSSTSKRKFWGYNLESLNYVPLSIFLEIGPPNNSWCASQVLFTYSVTRAFHWMHRLKHEQILMCVHE